MFAVMALYAIVAFDLFGFYLYIATVTSDSTKRSWSDMVELNVVIDEFVKHGEGS